LGQRKNYADPYHRVLLSEPRISSVLSGRDRILIGVFLLVNVVVILGVVLFQDSDEEDGGGGKESAQRIPRAGRVVVDRAIGARIRKPRGWIEQRADRTVILRSPDSSTTMSISQPPAAVRNRELLRQAVANIGKRHRRVGTRRYRGILAGRPTVSRVLSATNRRGVRLTILVAAPQGKGRAWLVQVISRPGARAKRLPQARAALGTLRLRG